MIVVAEDLDKAEQLHFGGVSRVSPMPFFAMPGAYVVGRFAHCQWIINPQKAGPKGRLLKFRGDRQGCTSTNNDTPYGKSLFEAILIIYIYIYILLDGGFKVFC